MKDEDKTKDQLINELILLRQRITELERLENGRKQAKEWESKYRHLFENLNNAAFLADAETGHIIETNKQGEVLLGRTREEIIGMHQSELHPPGKAKEYRQRFATHVDKGRAADYDGEAIRKDGSIVLVNISAAPLTIGGKRLIIGLFHDITERKQVEEALRESEQRHRTLIELAPDGIAGTDLKGVITSVNTAVLQFTGYSEDEIVGKHFSKIALLAPKDIPKYMKVFASVVIGKGVGTLRGAYRRKDGTEGWFEARGTPMKVNGKKLGIQAVIRDMTEHKRAEQELQKLYAHERELRQELEAEAKKRAEFLRALVHELKTPLTPMLASSELLINELQEEPLLSLARNINQGVSRLNDRIDELLDLARGEMGMLQLNFKSLDPLQLLHKVAYDLAPVASRRRQSLTLALRPLPTIQADEERLYQVVLNLLNNASKFTPEGGEITLRAEKKDTSLIVQVQDSGRGIAKEEQQRLFDPYYRVERDRGHLSGLGLGLALCKTLVELHGGQIWVESCVDKGSTFSFSVPLEAARQQAKGAKMGK